MLFQDTQVNITSQGRPYLGAALGSQEFVDQYVTKVELPQVTPIATLRRVPTSKIVTADLMSEVCHNVCVEPTLQPITGEALSGTSATTEDCARIDVAASGFWGDPFYQLTWYLPKPKFPAPCKQIFQYMDFFSRSYHVSQRTRHCCWALHFCDCSLDSQHLACLD